ncbi:alcohol dehydrogenase [Mucidula mucida]|nr:alcohol dehydrogenase [Mucidula mucida]
MAPIRNAVVNFNEIPTGYPIPGRTTVYDASQTVDLDNVPLNGGILIKTLVLSIDPYLRGKMRDASVKSLHNCGIARVVHSENADIKVGDHVTGVFNFQEYSIIPDPSRVGVRVIAKTTLPWSVYVGAAGMPGETAYFGYKEYAHAKKGDTIFLAKMDGLKVIASAGTDKKVAFMKELGADVVFNYKTEDTLGVLKREGPLDVYWDNVGGAILDAAIESMKDHGHIIACGAISAYNDPRGQHFKQLFARSLTINGFLVLDLMPKWEEDGEFKYREEIMVGLEHAGEALRKIQMGENVAKSVIVVAEE